MSIELQQVLPLIEFLASTPSADNSQPWHFSVSEQALRVSYREVKADVFGPDGHGSLMAFGAMRENAMQYVRNYEVRASLSEIPTGRALLEMTWNGALPARSAAHDRLPVMQRHTNRFPFKTDALPDAVLGMLKGLSEQGTRCVLVDQPESRARFAQAFDTASSARFCTPDLHEWLLGSLRFSADEVAAGDGLDIATLPLPPGGGAMMRTLRPWPRMRALNRIGLYRMFAAIETQPIRVAPLIVSIVGRADRQGTLDAGQLMQRAWIDLNAAGCAVQPVYVLTDHRSRLDAGRVPVEWTGRVRDALVDVESLLGVTPGERLHIAMRVGLPSRAAPRARRLPLDQLVSLS